MVRAKIHPFEQVPLCMCDGEDKKTRLTVDGSRGKTLERKEGVESRRGKPYNSRV